MKTHLIVAVHGIGEQKPGETIDSIVGAATTEFFNIAKDQDKVEAALDQKSVELKSETQTAETKPKFELGQRRFPVLVERDVINLAETKFDGRPRQAKLFPVHMRRVRRAHGENPDEQAVFAEVYWADKSPAPSGPLMTAFDLLRVILGLGYLAMENVESNRGWIATGIVHLFTWVFYGLVAPMNAVLLIGAILLLLDLTPYRINDTSIPYVLSAHVAFTIIIGFGLWVTARTYLIRLFGGGMTAIGLLTILAYLLILADHNWLLTWCAEPEEKPTYYFAGIECFIDLNILALGASWAVTVFLALLSYLTILWWPKTRFRTRYEGKKPRWYKDAVSWVRSTFMNTPWPWHYDDEEEDRSTARDTEEKVGAFRSIYPSICAGMVFFWMVMSSAFWILILNLSKPLRRPAAEADADGDVPPHDHLPDSMFHAVLERNLDEALQTLAVTLACVCVIILYCAFVLGLRKSISFLAKRSDFRPVYRRLPHLARVILNPGVRIIFAVSLLVISAAVLQQVAHLTQIAMFVSLAGLIPKGFETLITFTNEYRDEAIFGLLVLASVIYYFSNIVAGGLGAVRDIVVYATQKKCEWLSGRNTRRQNFIHRDDINDRFVATLWYGLETFQPMRLTVISHSQGTVIATHLLQQKRVKDLLNKYLSGDVTLVTMGSPVTHIYRRYFKEFFNVTRQNMFFREKKTEEEPDCVNWYNIFRTDDFVGTYIGENMKDVRTMQASLDAVIQDAPETSRTDLAINYAVEAKGHSGYFTDHQVWRVFHDKKAVNFRLFPTDGNNHDGAMSEESS